MLEKKTDFYWTFLKPETQKNLRLLEAEHLKVFASHKLLGLLCSENQEFHWPESVRTEWKSQWLRNQMFKQEALKIDGWFAREELSGCLLKGMAMLDGLYTDFGARFMCDIDLLVPSSLLDRVVELFNANDYTLVEEKKWQANHFKVLLQKPDEIPVTVELHTRLFFQHDDGKGWQTEAKEGYQKLHQLQREDHLLHLLGHLGYQHSILMLHWLVDIDRYLRKHSGAMDWARVKRRLEQLKQKRSAEIIFWILNNYLKTPIPKSIFPIEKRQSKFYHWLLTSDYLWQSGKSLRYYLVKHLCKDSLLDSLEYNWQWLLSRKKEMGG